MTKYLNDGLTRVCNAGAIFMLLLLLGAFQTVRADDAKQKPLMRNFMGICGHATFKPELYKPVCSYVRMYHPMWWDTDGDTTAVPPFPSGKDKILGTEPIDWSKLFGSWKDKGFTV